jgi:hypothetical protein
MSLQTATYDNLVEIDAKLAKFKKEYAENEQMIKQIEARDREYTEYFSEFNAVQKRVYSNFTRKGCKGPIDEDIFINNEFIKENEKMIAECQIKIADAKNRLEKLKKRI